MTILILNSPISCNNCYLERGWPFPLTFVSRFQAESRVRQRRAVQRNTFHQDTPPQRYVPSTWRAALRVFRQPFITLRHTNLFQSSRPHFPGALTRETQRGRLFLPLLCSIYIKPCRREEQREFWELCRHCRRATSRSFARWRVDDHGFRRHYCSAFCEVKSNFRLQEYFIFIDFYGWYGRLARLLILFGKFQRIYSLSLIELNIIQCIEVTWMRRIGQLTAWK